MATGEIVSIHLKQCVFCEKEWLLRDIEVDMPLIGENGSRLEQGVCKSCSEELCELPPVAFQNFSYNKMVRISDLRRDGNRGDHLRIEFHAEKEREGLVIDEIIDFYDRDVDGNPLYRLKRPFESRFRRFCTPRDLSRFDKEITKSKDEIKQLEKRISDFIDSLLPSSRTTLGTRVLYRINLECVIGNKCDSKAVEFIFLGNEDFGGEFVISDEFPQEQRIDEIICCGKKQIRRARSSPFFCSYRDESEHRCECKERDVDDDVKKAWRTYKKGHVNRGNNRRREERREFKAACEEHDEYWSEMDRILSSRYLGEEATGSSTIGGEWLEEEDFECAKLEECAISPTTRVLRVDIPGKMIGSGYICSECYGE